MMKMRKNHETQNEKQADIKIKIFAIVAVAMLQ